MNPQITESMPAVTHNAMPLFARATPQTDWNASLASQLLQQRFGRPWQRQDLLQAMIVIQHHFGAITPAAQQWLAQQCDTDCGELRSLIQFYHFLEEDTPLPLRLHFSSNIIEIHQGMRSLYSQLKANTGGHAQLSLTSCIGLGDQGPAALVNGYPLTHLNTRRLDGITQHLRQSIPLQDWPAQWFEVHNNIRKAGPILSFQPEPAAFLSRIASINPQQIITRIIDSGLRGRGGAGFPTGVKWQHCANSSASEHYVICNADEGEPGTFKDRVLLQHNADALFCGMALCAKAIGARKGILYVRGEYLFLFAPLQQRLHEWRQNHWLDTHFDIDIHLGAGAYVCGEETALLESVEGKRGVPRIKPPYPVSQGLYQMPTVINNVETFVAAAWIAQHGPDAFRQYGTTESTGTHLHSLSGDCARPGIYEYPFGTPVRELLEQSNATHTAWVQLGGPSGAMIDDNEIDSALAFESVSPGGAVMIFDKSRSLLDITKNFTAFFQHESCGFCSPCRAGTQMMKRDLERPDPLHNRIALQNLAQLVNDTSHCGLGQTAGRPILNWIKREQP